jgi:uncharacterized repeat protein (TIGR01451 family)
VWGGVRYVGLYSGVDLELMGENGQVVPRLVAHPGADLSMVRLRVEGAEAVELLPGGEALRLATGVGEFTLPLLMVEGGEGWRRPSVVARATARQAFEVAAPFASLNSPPQSAIQDQQSSNLLYATFLGGSSYDWGEGIAVDSSGAAYVTGNTQSFDFPITPGAYDLTYGGGLDAFVVKLNPSGGGLAYATFLGGWAYDYGADIAVDSNGAAYITGITNSDDFPITLGAYDTTYNGGYSDAFVVKLDPSGGLIYGTFLGGNSVDSSYSIVVDSNGAAYVAGYTDSFNFPTTLGAYDRTYHGNGDAFIVKLNPSGGGLAYATFLGSGNWDYGHDIAVDSSGAAYITGSTSSPDFPTTPGAYDSTYNSGYSDAFIVKLEPSGGGLAYATFLGGSGDDRGYGIAVDSSGVAYVTGNTSSSDFPTTPGAYDRTYGGGICSSGGYTYPCPDAFVVKLNLSDSSISYSTFLGGSNRDEVSGIAIDSSGNAYLTGQTNSSDFPTTLGAFDTTYGGGTCGSGTYTYPCFDAFVVKMNPTGTTLLYSSFLGGSAGDGGNGIAVDSSGNAYVTGGTWSSDFPTTPGAYDPTFNGYDEAFVAKLNFLPNLSCSTKQANIPKVMPGQPVTYTLTLYNCGSADALQAWVTDALPISLTYQAGSLWASMGTYGEAGGIITWTGSLAAGISATIRFSAVISPALSPADTLAIINAALVDDGWHAPFRPTAVVFINPRQVYLPLILRNR